MRLLIVIVVLLLLAFFWWPLPESAPEYESEPVSATTEANPIGERLAPLSRAQQFQQKDYLEGLDQHRQQMDAAEAADGG